MTQPNKLHASPDHAVRLRTRVEVQIKYDMRSVPTCQKLKVRSDVWFSGYGVVGLVLSPMVTPFGSFTGPGIELMAFSTFASPGDTVVVVISSSTALRCWPSTADTHSGAKLPIATIVLPSPGVWNGCDGTHLHAFVAMQSASANEEQSGALVVQRAANSPMAGGGNDIGGIQLHALFPVQSSSVRNVSQAGGVSVAAFEMPGLVFSPMETPFGSFTGPGIDCIASNTFASPGATVVVVSSSSRRRPSGRQ